MINFTVGPVQSSIEVREIGKENVPYFRTNEFSQIMLENEKLMKQFARSGENSRVIFITGSGTASMEASVMNTLSKDDKAIVINGGSFGQRFEDILTIHEIPYDAIRLEHGKALKEEHLLPFDNKGYTAFIVNVHETSTGVHYDLDLISKFCKKNNLFLIVDAISSFLADDIDMANLNVDILITGSQKALACPPGISIIVLSERAVNKVNDSKVKTLYFDLKSSLLNQERGQTPFTPAVGTLLQIHARLKQIERDGGVLVETQKIQSLAEYFRQKIVEMPFEIVSESMSNAVTPLHPLTADAYDIFLTLKDEYGIWVCPNGGDMKHTIFRVGHIGDLTKKDYDILLDALKDMQKRGLI